ncbi:hypothetical protein A2U01_0018431, partial [Trifolium medium]|nr:hypothetical protein [Trifolium medium]
GFVSKAQEPASGVTHLLIFEPLALLSCWDGIFVGCPSMGVLFQCCFSTVSAYPNVTALFDWFLFWIGLPLVAKGVTLS